MTTENPKTVAPHPTLNAYYGADAQRERFVRQLFDRTSHHYEWIDNVLSFGWGVRYREKALASGGLTAGMKILDVATGTGVVARAARNIVGTTGRVTGMDPSVGMLAAGRKVSKHTTSGGVAESLPFQSNSFDFVSMGYALRHVRDLRTTFDEFFRVLKPGGKLLILEISKPRSRFARLFLSLYMGRIVPSLVRLGTRSSEAQTLMQYYWDTTDQCVAPEVITSTLSASRFAAVERIVTFGIFSDYRAVKP